MEQQPAAQPEADGSAVKQADGGFQHLPTSSSILQADALLAEEQPSKRRCVRVCTCLATLKDSQNCLCSVQRDLLWVVIDILCCAR